MTVKKLEKITNKQITEKGVQSLADRPNLSAQHGASGLSPQQLKLWFDKLATFLAEKVNLIIDTISSDSAAEYIRIVLDGYGVENLSDLVTSFTNGNFASKILQVAPSASATQKKALQTVINTLAQEVASLTENKLTKVTTTNTYRRAYIIMPNGTQATVLIAETPVGGAIPLYTSGGQICAAIPVLAEHVSNKGYTDERDALLGATMDLSIDPITYLMTLRLKNTAGTVLSVAQVDLPLASMVLGGSYADGVLTLRLKNNDGHIEENAININISDLIDGLVSTSTYNNGVATLNARIDGTNNNLQAFIDEIELSKIYAHAAFHAEESETARNYTRGGSIDKKFKEIDCGNGFSIDLSMDNEYKLSIGLKNKRGDVISSGMVDLPIETLITKASYSKKVLTLTLQNGNTLKVDISDIISGLVPDTRKINGKTLEEDISLTADDVGAYGKNDTYSKSETSNLLTAQKTELQANIDGKQVVGYAYQSTESEKASGYTKGGLIDKEFTALKKRLATLENPSET